jgi:hypothetical protein
VIHRKGVKKWFFIVFIPCTLGRISFSFILTIYPE